MTHTLGECTMIPDSFLLSKRNNYTGSVSNLKSCPIILDPRLSTVKNLPPTDQSVVPHTLSPAQQHNRTFLTLHSCSLISAWESVSMVTAHIVSSPASLRRNSGSTVCNKIIILRVKLLEIISREKHITYTSSSLGRTERFRPNSSLVFLSYCWNNHHYQLHIMIKEMLGSFHFKHRAFYNDMKDKRKMKDIHIAFTAISFLLSPTCN